jgi:hypothetical protein
MATQKTTAIADPSIRFDPDGNPLIETDFGWRPITGHMVRCVYTRADKKQAWGDGYVTKAVGQKLTIKLGRSVPHPDILIETTVSSINATWKLRFPYTPKCGKLITYCAKPAGHNGQCMPVGDSVNGKPHK